MTSATDHSVAGDSASWMLFERATERDYPLVVLARHGNPVLEGALEDALITVVTCEADVALVNDLGMPQQTDRIYPLEDFLARELAAFDVGAMHAASITGDGERRMVYVHTAPLDFAPLLDACPVPGYTLTATAPKDRAALVALITPTALDHQLSGDMGVISTLAQNGDDGSQPRKTEFWFYGDRPALDAAAHELAVQGFAFSHETENGEGVVLAADITPEFTTFRRLTPMLLDVAARHGVTYDGWETFVWRPEPLAPEPQQQRGSFLSRLFGGKKS